jgi:hypothetical protein
MHAQVRWWAAVALLAVGGCGTGRPRTDAAARRSLEWDVEGASPRTWGAALHFGPYRTATPPDGTIRGWSTAVLGANAASGHLPYAWRITGGSADVDVECVDLGPDVRTAAAADPAPADASGRPVLACAIRLSRGGEAPRTWTLALRASGARASDGYLGSLREGGSANAYDVASSYTLESGRLGPPAAFTVARGDDLVELVETLGGGRVWIGAVTGDTDALAAAATALLLFRPADA